MTTLLFRSEERYFSCLKKGRVWYQLFLVMCFCQLMLHPCHCVMHQHSWRLCLHIASWTSHVQCISCPCTCSCLGCHSGSDLPAIACVREQPFGLLGTDKGVKSSPPRSPSWFSPKIRHINQMCLWLIPSDDTSIMEQKHCWGHEVGRAKLLQSLKTFFP